MNDYSWMTLALNLASKGLYTTDPNPRVGCVLVKNNQLIGQGWHKKSGENHAEINALEDAGSSAKGSTAYVTLEPCVHHGKTPPCADALIAAQVKKVIIAMQDPNPLVQGRGIAKLKHAGIEVETGLLEQDAVRLNPGFIKRMQEGRPFIRLKLAMSLDGRTAMASGESKWITGPAARLDVQKLRARSSAILTGAGTVLQDDPSLNVRDIDIGRQPLRVILDTDLQTLPTAKIFTLPGRVILVTCATDQAKIDKLKKSGIKILQLPAQDSQVDLFALMSWLAGQSVNELHLEAGALLSGAFIKTGLVDEVIIYLASKIMGNTAKPLFNLNIVKMSETFKLKFTDYRMLGDDLKITAIR